MASVKRRSQPRRSARDHTQWSPRPRPVWADTDRLHVLTADGARIKSCPSRLSQRDLARLRADGGRPAGPSPCRPQYRTAGRGG